METWPGRLFRFCFPKWIFTLILELGFNMMYLIEPWMFSVHDTSQVTLLSCRTSFHLCPGGGAGILESLQRIRKQMRKAVWRKSYQHQNREGNKQHYTKKVQGKELRQQKCFISTSRKPIKSKWTKIRNVTATNMYLLKNYTVHLQGLEGDWREAHQTLAFNIKEGKVG